MNVTALVQIKKYSDRLRDKNFLMFCGQPVTKTENNTKNIELVFQYLDELLEKKENPKPRKQIGFKIKTGKKN